MKQFLVSRSKWLLLLALWCSLLPNLATLRGFLMAPSAGEGAVRFGFFMGGWLITLAVLLLSFTLLIGWLPRQLLKWCTPLVLIIAAATGFFSFFYGVQFDHSMLINVLQTNVAEAQDLISLKLIAWVAIVGLLPAFVSTQISINLQPSWVKSWLKSIGISAVVAAIAIAGLFSQYSRHTSAMRNKAVTFHTVAPMNVVAAAASAVLKGTAAQRVRMPLGTDAAVQSTLDHPRVLVFVLGETARAASYELNGYDRPTNPRMKALDGLYFPNTIACGTTTAISVPCMFSGLTQDSFSLFAGLGRETLVDVFKYAGVDVIWYDNDGGCKGVCNAAKTELLGGENDPKYCLEAGECRDEVLVEKLAKTLPMIKKDTVVFLHLKGSHGPAYYKRYSKQFEVFSPACKSNELSSCSNDEIRNAYDNTIVYTDHVIGQLVELLKARNSTLATSLLYVSDHGESTGENGLYLHGLPYAVAPDTQTRVPLYIWMSESLKRLEIWEAACLQGLTKAQRSHDNIFSTALGLMDIKTLERKAALDILHSCDRRRG